jgi:hypothetical protein
MAFYLQVGRHAQERARRGNPAAAVDLVMRSWTSWRGKAVEPVVRDALWLAAGRLRWPAVTAVGGWRNRAFQPEIDLIGADRAPVASTLYYAGSIKWLSRPFDGGDLAALQRGAAVVPGFEPGTTDLIAVSRSGIRDMSPAQLALHWGPEDVVGAFC